MILPPPPADPAPHRGYVITVLLALDMLLNALCDGRLAETLSARMGRHAFLTRVFFGRWPRFWPHWWVRHRLWTIGALPVLPKVLAPLRTTERRSDVTV